MDDIEIDQFRPEDILFHSSFEEIPVKNRKPNIPEIEFEEEPGPCFYKNTESFRCLEQFKLSRSSLLLHPLFFFPPLEDPGLDESFNYIEPDPVYDNVGCQKYLDVCKELNIIPLSRICRSLPTETLNLKFYGLTEKQTKAVTESLKINVYVKELILQDNWLTLESSSLLSYMLENNNTIRILNLRECRIGALGAEKLNESILTSQILQDIDLSFNDLGDTGLLALKSGLIMNTSVRTFNISHNNLTEESGQILHDIFTENKFIEDLDLSWNFFYTALGNKKMFKGFQHYQSLKRLNLSWNGIRVQPAARPISMFLRKSTVLEEFDISHNRLQEGALSTIKLGISKCPSIKKVKIGTNCYNPQDAYNLALLLVRKPDFVEMDMENMTVDKQFLTLVENIKNLEKTVTYGHVLGNWTIKGPDQIKLLFNRCRFILQKPKKKKAKKDFSHFVLKLPDNPKTEPQVLEDLLKKEKMKLLIKDADIVNLLLKTFKGKKASIDCVALKETYMKYHPDATLPPPKEKKKKKGKGKKDKNQPEPENKETQPKDALTDQTGAKDTETKVIEEKIENIENAEHTEKIEETGNTEKPENPPETMNGEFVPENEGQQHIQGEAVLVSEEDLTYQSEQKNPDNSNDTEPLKSPSENKINEEQTEISAANEEPVL